MAGKTGQSSRSSVTPASRSSAPAKKTSPKKTAATKAAPNSGTAKKTTTKAAPKSGTAKKATTRAASTSGTAKKATTKAAPTSGTAKKTATQKARSRTAKVAEVTKLSARQLEERGDVLPVRGDEDPWTADELAEVRATLLSDLERLTGELATIENDIITLMQDSGEGNGDDQADAGTKTYEREQEFTVAQNSRSMMEQSTKALAAIADGTYGECQGCGNAIGKMRLQAFPRATLCVTCKQKQERH